MANQNFRVKNGINVGTAVTITTAEYQVGTTRIHSSGVEARNITVTDNAGISTVPQLKLTGRLYDANNNVGTGTSVLVSTGIGVSWIAIATAALQGVQGVQGTLGTQGTQGTQGVQGTQGTQGIQGTQGVQGIQGTQGTQGVQGITGAQGFNGTLGTQGVQGIQGVQGAQGFNGTLGSQGTTGAQGTTGTQGIQGITGSQGSQGTQGIQGITGTQGATGAQGITGTQGTTGAQGATGSQGTTGSTGTQGATGTQGTLGTQGATGPSTTINATAVTTNSTFYPVFVAAAGSNQTASVRTTSTAFSFNPSTGDLTVGGTVTSSSDENIKENIQIIQNALDKVCQLRGVEFDYKETGKHSIGFIAQEVEQIIPELVFGNNPKSVAYQNFVALLVEAIKELKREVDFLKHK